MSGLFIENKFKCTLKAGFKIDYIAPEKRGVWDVLKRSGKCKDTTYSTSTWLITLVINLVLLSKAISLQ